MYKNVPQSESSVCKKKSKDKAVLIKKCIIYRINCHVVSATAEIDHKLDTQIVIQLKMITH